ncbi:hypothetical protein CO174_04950 [Candidatus Uhrbacteria bacterium CG_4_9_14_3_um_filter_50_9]|uniref:DUF948 domain-containing protein n=1 Tax=Candidatus Uhrbacteria bacterium CG_4_9_14_3_um_filter_50_9 TaxID=1975035 RepID=A0A2M7XBC3_9BACT|nr:MAG: hypothetical protein CO174_04950 [Candidatus Uhrbacteria bacterium CG_4_9_14_3_um_filter_50_9]
MFSPLEVLYIVLAFCALWFTAGIFWIIWQIATVIRTVNMAVGQVQETMSKMEEAITGIRSKFDNTSASLGAVVHTATKAVEYIMEKKLNKAAKRATAKKSTSRKKKMDS